MYRAFCAYVKSEKGYTYIELTIALSLLIVLFPAVFFLVHTLEEEFKKIVSREQLQMEYLAFHSLLTRELSQATSLSLEGQDLIANLHTGESIRYEYKKRRIVRSVKRVGETHYLGSTILLQHTYFATLIPDKNGVYVNVGLQNWHSNLDLSTYIGKRVNTACGLMSGELLYP